MTDKYKNRFITTYGEWQYNPETDSYDLINRHGFWYQGPVALAGHDAATWVAEDWRFHHWDYIGTDFGVIWLDSENSVTNVKLGPLDYFRFRWSFGETGAGNYNNYGYPILQYYHDQASSPAWTDVGVGDGEGIKLSYAAHPSIADGYNDSTERLTNSTLSAQTYQSSWNEFVESNVVMTPRTWSNDYAEFETALRLGSSAYFSVNDTIRLRVIWTPGGAVTVPFDTEPVITIAAPSYAIDHWQMCYPVTGSACELWTGVGSEDTSYEIPSANLDTAYAICIGLANYGGLVGSAPFQLEYKIGSGGTWADVNASSSYVRSAATGDADGTNGIDYLDSNRRLTLPTGLVFLDYSLDESDGSTVLRSLESDIIIEYYFGIQFLSADLSGGEEIYFRLTDTTDTYTVTLNVNPVVTIEQSGGTVNNKTLQDLNSTATTDAYIMEKKLRRDITDTFVADDSALPLRSLIREILDTAAATDDAIPTYEQGATIVSRTLQDLNSIGVTDAPGTERERDRETLETIDLNDLTEEERERIRKLLDEADLSYAAETRHKRTIELLDSWIGLLDSVTAVRSAAPQGGTFTDEIAVTDALIIQQSLVRELLDTLAALDTALVLRERYPTIFDALGATDAIDVFRQMERLTIDTSELSDDAIELRQRNRALIDLLTTADIILTRLERNRTLLDTVAVTDAVDATYIPRGSEIIEKQLSDLLAMTDALISLRERYRKELDDFAVTDALKKISESRRNILDSIVTADNDIELRERYRQASESLGIVDAIDSETERRRSVLDALGVNDTDVKLRKRYRLLSDTFALIDSVTVQATGVASRTITDLLNVIDTATTLRQNYRQQADGIDLSDSVKRNIFNWSVLTDIADLSDNEIALRERYRVLSESIEVLDSVIAEAEGIISRTLSDSAVVVDAIEALRLLERELTDSADLADFPIPERLRDRLLADGADLTDSVSWAKIKSYLLTDTLAFDEFLERILARGRVASENVTFSETVIATYLPEGILTYYKTVVEALRITDSALGQHIYPLIDFIIRHSIQSIAIDHDIERFHIRHNVEKIT